MIKMVFCLRRKAGMTREEFQHYWLVEHAPKVKAVAEQLGMKRYVQSHTYDSAMGTAAARGRNTAEDYDGVMEGWWESEDQSRAAFEAHGPAAALMLLDDERRFIDLERSAIFMTREQVIF